MLFVAIIHLLTQPVAEFWQLFVVGLGIYEVCINIEILASILLADSRALTVSVVIICICIVLSGENPTLTQLQHSLGISIPYPLVRYLVLPLFHSYNSFFFFASLFSFLFLLKY